MTIGPEPNSRIFRISFRRGIEVRPYHTPVRASCLKAVPRETGRRRNPFIASAPIRHQLSLRACRTLANGPVAVQ